jgi:hypothetical protein
MNSDPLLKGFISPPRILPGGTIHPGDWMEGAARLLSAPCTIAVFIDRGIARASNHRLVTSARIGARTSQTSPLRRNRIWCLHRRPNLTVLLGRFSLVWIAGLWRGLLEDGEPASGNLHRLCRDHVPPSVRRILNDPAVSRGRSAECSRDHHLRTADHPIGQTCLARHFLLPFDCYCWPGRFRADVGMANASAVLVCAPCNGRSYRSDIWEAAELLPVHSASVAGHQRLAYDAGDRDLWRSGIVSRHHERLSCTRQTTDEIWLVALAGALHHGRVSAARPCYGGVCRSVPEFAGASHDL